MRKTAERERAEKRQPEKRRWNIGKLIFGKQKKGNRRIRKKERKAAGHYKKQELHISVEMLVERVDEEIKGILRSNLYEAALNKTDAGLIQKNKEMLRRSLRMCGTGDEAAKEYVKMVIQDILLEKFMLTAEDIENVIPFHKPERLELRDKFYLLLKKYGQEESRAAFNHLLECMRWLDREEEFFEITSEQIEDACMQQKTVLDFPEKLRFLTQKVYEKAYGLGVIDELCTQKIDGISGGTSEGGEIQQSIWVQWKGKNVYLSFLAFGSEEELIRVCKRIYRFGHIGQLAASRGYIVNELADHSRVVVTRPPFSESWSFFVRRFDTIEDKTLETLLVDRNAQLAVTMLKWLIRSCITIGISGSQGSGKTTLLTALVAYIPESLTLRIQEMNYELHLRKRYPKRNIVSFRETETISSQEGLDLQKKTDGAVNILGEVATHEAGSYLIQMGMVASLFTMFTHHAVTTEGLVMALRNNLLALGQFHREEMAEEQVVEVVSIDVHLNKDYSGHRYLERITEIIPVKGEDRCFVCRDLLRFDKGSYVLTERPSGHLCSKMEKQLNRHEWEEWNEWYAMALAGQQGDFKMVSEG